MKKRKEGTLEAVEFSGRKNRGREVGDDFEKALAKVATLSFTGLPDFIAKARALIGRVDAMPDRMRAERSRSLSRDLDAIERAVKRGVDQSAMYDAIGAALTYAALANAERDDAKAFSKKKSIRVGQVLAAESRVHKNNLRRGVQRRPSNKEIADELGVRKNSVDRVFRRDITEK